MPEPNQIVTEIPEKSSDTSHHSILHRLPLWYTIPFILLIIILIPSLIILVITRQPIINQPVPTQQPAPTSVPTPSPIPESTSNWKTYTNEELHYFINYPSTWQIRESSSEGYPYITLIDPIAQVIEPGQTETFSGAIIEIYVDNRGTWYGDKPLEGILPLTGPGGSAEEYQKQDLLGISGVEYSLFRENYDKSRIFSKGFGSIKTINDKELIYDIKLSIFNYDQISKEQINSYVKTFDQILSTFRFLAERENLTFSDAGDGWQIVTNKMFNYSLNIPTNWKVYFISSYNNSSNKDNPTNIRLYYYDYQGPFEYPEGEVSIDSTNHMAITLPIEGWFSSEDNYLNNYYTLTKDLLGAYPVVKLTPDNTNYHEGPPYPFIYILQHNERIYTISLGESESKSNRDKFDQQYNQILSTFRFLDSQAEQSCLSDEDCSSNYFCDIKYLCPRGYPPEKCQDTGTHQCIQECADDNDCPSQLTCQEITIMKGDIMEEKKGCLTSSP